MGWGTCCFTDAWCCYAPCIRNNVLQQLDHRLHLLVTKGGSSSLRDHTHSEARGAVCRNNQATHTCLISFGLFRKCTCLYSYSLMSTSVLVKAGKWLGWVLQSDRLVTSALFSRPVGHLWACGRCECSTFYQFVPEANVWLLFVPNLFLVGIGNEDSRAVSSRAGTDCKLPRPTVVCKARCNWFQGRTGRSAVGPIRRCYMPSVVYCFSLSLFTDCPCFCLEAAAALQAWMLCLGPAIFSGAYILASSMARW